MDSPRNDEALPGSDTGTGPRQHTAPAYDTAAAALAYAAAGVPVFPCRPDKRPYTANGFKDATTNETIVRGWWRRWPDALIGRPTGAASGAVAVDIDVDPSKGTDGTEALAALEHVHGPLPETWTARTPRGGTHIYFRHPGGTVPCSAGKIGHGIDIRGDGGYVIAPPSTLPDGRGYEWLADGDPDEGGQLADLPEWLLSMIHAPERAQVAQGPAPEGGHLIMDGQRNDTLFRLGRSLRAKGLTEAGIVAALLAENTGRCVPPLSDDEVLIIARSAGKVPPGHSAEFDTERSENRSQNHRHNSHDRHADESCGNGADPQTEAIAAAVATCQDALRRCAEDPGILARTEFVTAARLLRERAPDEWFAVRGPLKEASRTAGLRFADIEHATRPQGEAGPDDSTVADELVALVQDCADLFHAADGTCYAALTGDGPARTYRLDTQAFAEWLGFAYFESTKTKDHPGRAASDTAIRTARTVLVGIAKHAGDERRVYLRTAQAGGTYFVDLGTDDGGAVEVTAGGWRIIARPTVHFWRTGTLRPLPVPVAGGNLELLWQYANIPPAARPLVTTWMLDAWRPETPFAVLELVGQQGTAKSSTQAKLRRCIDPNAVDLRAAPKSVEDLFVSAGANWVASLNNLSHLSAPMQDALCNLATGGGFAGRTLFTNCDETVFEAKRPVMLNGIVPLVTAQDLTDRVVHVALPELASYRPEVAIDAEFEQDAPRIVGGLLDLFVRTLAKLPEVHLPKPPRMADFAALGEAMTLAQGGTAGAFLAIYLANRRESISRSLEASPVARAIRRLVDEYRGADETVWQGNMGALLDRLTSYREGADAWPKSARGLSDAVRRQRPALAQVGVGIDIGAHGRDGVPVTIRRLLDNHTSTPCDDVTVVTVDQTADSCNACQTPDADDLESRI